MSEQLPATRMELLRLKGRIKLAKKGHRLLKQKRDGLIKQFFDLMADYYKAKKAVREQLQDTYETIQIAQGVSGVNRVKTLAYSAEESCQLEVTEKNLMGVKVPEIKLTSCSATVNASLIGTSHHVEESLKKSRSLLPALIKLAETEQVLFTLAEEIKKVKRRVNALEHVQIPKLEEQQRDIKMRLAELERESFTRLKHVKEQIENQEMA